MKIGWEFATLFQGKQPTKHTLSFLLYRYFIFSQLSLGIVSGTASGRVTTQHKGGSVIVLFNPLAKGNKILYYYIFENIYKLSNIRTEFNRLIH